MSNMTDRERLLRWMQEKDFDLETLAEVTGDSFSSMYMMLNAKRPIGDKFKWRFAQNFGLDEAAKIFADAPPATIHKALAA